MTDDLVKRLRYDAGGCFSVSGRYTTAEHAADRIEQLQAERAAALSALRVAREALKYFADYSIPKDCEAECVEVMCGDLRRARAAISEIDKVMGDGDE